MILSHDFTVSAPTDEVYDALISAEVLGSVPGIRLRGHPERGTAAGEVDLTVHGEKITYRGKATSRDADRDAGALAVDISGREVKGRTPVHCAVTLRMRWTAGATTVSLKLDVEGGGKTSRADPAEVAAAVQTLVDSLAAVLSRHFAAGVAPPAAEAPVREVPPSPPPPAAPAAPRYGSPWPVTDPPVDHEPGANETSVSAGWEASDEDLRELRELVADLERPGAHGAHEADDAEEAMSTPPGDHPEDAAGAEHSLEADLPPVPPPSEPVPVPPLPSFPRPETSERPPPVSSPGPDPVQREAPPPAAVAQVGATAPPWPHHPEPGAYRREGAHVPGRVHVVTDGPLDGHTLPIGDSLYQRARALTRRRPWIIPAAVVGVVALVVILRRRSAGA